MKPESVDIVVTSPPYNLGLQYRSYNDKVPREEYIVWTMKWIEETKRVLSEEGSLFVNLGSAPSNPLLPHQLVLRIGEYLRLQNTFHWIKSISIGTTENEIITSGHFKPINSHRFVNDCHEYVFHFTKTGNVKLNRLKIGVPYKDKSNVKRWKHNRGTDKRCRGNTWFIPYETIQRKHLERPHPATFPVRLARNCILLHGVRADTTVVDPFLGLGNAAIAAYQCEVTNFVGYDIEVEYLKYAKEALKKEIVSEKPIRLTLYGAPSRKA